MRGSVPEPIICGGYTWGEMLPFIHIGIHFVLNLFGRLIPVGPWDVPTFGLMLWVATVSGAVVMHWSFRRARVEADALGIVALTVVAGIVGAKLWHVLDSPAEFQADGWSVLWSTGGFAWFGGLVAGIIALLVASVTTVAWALTIGPWMNAAMPWRDAFIAAFSVAAQILQVRKNIENWPLWVVVNLVAVASYWSAELAFTAFLYLVYLGLAVAGWRLAG